MPTKKLSKKDREYLEKLGSKIKKIILENREFSSLDRFALENHDFITKPTLYQICQGKRDMKLTTILGLSRALHMSLRDLLTLK